MLEKLPSLLKNLQARLSLLNLQKKPNDQVSEFVEPSEYSYPREVILYRRISVIISVIFIFLIGLNLLLDANLNLQKKNLDLRVAKTDSYSEFEKSYRNTAETLNRYQSLMKIKSNMYDRFLLVYYSIPEGVSVTNLVIDQEKFKITLSSKNVLLYSKLINTYIKDPLTKTLYLDSAYLTADPVDDSSIYTVSMRGEFK